MKTNFFKLFTLIVLLLATYSCEEKFNSYYLGQTPPGNTPIIFKLPVDSGFFAAERIAISSDGKEIYYGHLDNYPAEHGSIRAFKYYDNKWNGPFTLFEGFAGPALSTDGKKLYTHSHFALRNDTGWTALKKFWNYSNHPHYLQVTNSGKYYFADTPTRGGIGGTDWSTLLIEGADTIIQSLGAPLNNSSNQGDFYIARDESYIISANDVPSSGASSRPLFISYHKENRGWTNPKNLGLKVNKYCWNWGVYVSPDSKYLFFSAITGNNYSSIRTMWVRVDGLIDSLKHTNFEPYQFKPISDTMFAYINKEFSYALPDSTFVDDNDSETLEISVKQSNGEDLPAWLSFDPKSKKMTGFPREKGEIEIKISATDSEGAIVSDGFRLIIKKS